MRCTACGYTLWNLAARTCPECGTGFRPSQFTFKPNAVRYCCPHCRQDYYGTSPEGHLIPREFTCVSCAREIAMDDMILLPAEGVGEDDAEQFELPWTNPHGGGVARRWWGTVISSLIRPGDLMSARNESHPVRSALSFFALTAVMALLIGAVLQALCFGVLFGLAAGGGGGAGAGGQIGAMALFQAIGYAVGIVFMMVMLVLWGGSTHVLLRLTGTIGGTWRTTAHAMLYSGGTFVLSIIPCINNFAGIWWVVSASIMVKRGQGVSGLRATFAVLTFPVLLVLAFVGLYAWFIYYAVSVAGAGTTVIGGVRDTTGLHIVADAIVERAEDQGGWDHTDHAMLLVLEDVLAPWDMVAMDTPTVPADIPLGNMTLAQLDEPSRETLERARAALPALPENVVAHRVGDYVFTYHGIDAQNPPPDLWIVIEDDLTGSMPDYYAITADGTEVFVNSTVRTSQLNMQNLRRATHGLPPLPDPADVTHKNPAVAPPITDADDAPP